MLEILIQKINLHPEAKKFVIFIALFGIGVLIPRVTLKPNSGPDYGGIVIDVRDNYYLFQY